MERLHIKQNYKKLEFSYILDKVAQYALSEQSRAKIIDTMPETDITLVKRRHEILAELNRLTVSEGKLELTPFVNFLTSLEGITKGFVPGAVSIYEIAAAIKQYFYIRKRITLSDYELLPELVTVTKLSEPLHQEILKHIKPDGYVESTASSELRDVRRKIGEIEARIKSETASFFRSAKSSGYTVDDIISVRDGLSCVAIKSNYRNRMDGVVVDSSATGQTVYVVPEKTLKLNNELVTCHEREKEEIRKILEGYCEKMITNYEALSIIHYELIEFDLYHARSRFALRYEYNSPEITKERELRIIDGKHPLIGEEAVPLNIVLGDQFNMLVITGPNTGGKTVVLKTLGLFSLMVQSGIPIPASSSSRFCLFDNVFIDIGDEQSIEQSLSTFSGHIKNIKEILENTTELSLVLLDELGGGTDPIEGSALAISIISYLKSKGLLGIVTTHYSSIKNFAASEELIENGSMEFDSVHLKPTYNLMIGIPGSSRALEISERLGLSSRILDGARQFLDADYLQTEKMIEKLESEKIILEREKKEFALKVDELSRERAMLDERSEKVKEKNSRLNKMIMDKEYDFISEARKEFENLVRLVKSEGASKDSILKGKEFISRFEEKISKKSKKQKRKSSPVNLETGELVVGDSVRMISNGLDGTVLSRGNSKDEYVVQFGIMKLNCKRGDLRRLEQKKPKIETKIAVEAPPKSMKLDLRGARYDEAEMKMEQFMQQAIINSIPEIQIIHGKGTGVIRNFVQTYLKKSPYIKEFNFEKLSEYQTNYGVTIAKLK